MFDNTDRDSNRIARYGDTKRKDSHMRLQLALNVPDLDKAVDFYTKLFATEPYKTKPGYANFEIAEPPLKLVLFESADAEPGSINHLGVETESADDVVAAEQRLAAAGLATSGVDETICCFAEKVETWVEGPDNTRWEWYVKAADHDTGFENVVVNTVEAEGACSLDSGCCGPLSASEPEAVSAQASAGGCC